MRERRFRVPLYFTAEEKADLHSKAEAACMNYNRFIRMLIAGYDPVVIPDDIFYESMEMIRQFADKIDEVAIKADNSAEMDYPTFKIKAIEHSVKLVREMLRMM